MQKRVLFIINKCSIEPLGIMYLSSGLKKFGHEVDLYKYADRQSLEQYLRWHSPDIVGLSMTTGQHVGLLRIASEVKNCNAGITVVVGGAHPTYFPEVANNPNIDYAIKGEADFSFPEFVNDFPNGISPGVKLIDNKTLPESLDDISFPDRSIVYKYQDYYNNGVRNILTSRGCPYNCSYCYNSSYKKMYKGQKIVRYRSPENIIRECKEVMQMYPTNMFFFADDEFSMNISRLKEIKDLYIKNIKLPFHCQIRIDLLNEERISILKEMGCYSLTFAIESGNEELRKSVLNRNITNGQIIEGCGLLKKNNIKFRAENMIGIPSETWGNVVETLDLNIAVKPDYAWVSLYQPYPFTVLGEYSKKHNLFDGNIDIINEQFSEDTVLNMPQRDKRRLINLQRLFGIIVSFPWLRAFLPIILNVRNNKIYTKIRDYWKKYCYEQKIFMCKIREEI